MNAVITPGRLKDRKGFRAGPWKGSGLARAALGTLLGPYTFNLQAKVQAGQAIAYVTNGFKCAPHLLLSLPSMNSILACSFSLLRDFLAVQEHM